MSSIDARGPFSIEADAPKDRCGFTTRYGEGSAVEAGNVSCWRRAWRDGNLCIWHSDIDKKPSQELERQRTRFPERLDGAILSNVNLSRRTSFSQCYLPWSTFAGGNYSDADFSKANLASSIFSGASCTDTNFDGANLENCDFSEAGLQGATLTNANLLHADFSETDLRNGDLSETFLSGADEVIESIMFQQYWGPDEGDGFSGSPIDMDFEFDLATFEGSTLSHANFSNSELRHTKFKNTTLDHADLQNAELYDANLSQSDLHHANLAEADLRGANLHSTDCRRTKFSNAILINSDIAESNFSRANLERVDIRSADCSGSNFFSADLSEADGRETILEDAVLEQAVLNQTDLRYARLRNVSWFQAHFSDVRIDLDTDFGEECTYERSEERDGWWANVSTLEAAVWTYRQLEEIHKKNALSEAARHYHIRKQEARRKHHKQQGNHVDRGLLEMSRWLTTHNDSPLQVVKVSIAVILGSAALYPLIGGITDTGVTVSGPTYRWLPILVEWTPTDLVLVFLKSLYFSIVTFTTLGFGDVQPATGTADALASIESFLGVLLMALLVFVLGRRTTW